ncbi:MAG: DMT family transporter [Acidiferrobacteraceae bacterium]
MQQKTGLMTYFPLILAGVLLNAGAQLLLKEGMRRIGHFSFAWDNVAPVGLKVISNAFVLGGLSFYVVSVVVWLLVLSRVSVSFAYPMLSIGYIVNAIGARFLFGETLSVWRITGILVIIAGVFLVAQN